MRTIKVTGKGQINVHPDMTRITMMVEGLYREYADTLRHSSEDIEKLKDVLAPFGFERKDLKTLNFSVDPEFEMYKEKEIYKQRFIGYKYRHIVKIEFDSENDRLGRILYALATCPVKPEFHLSYTVKDPEAVKNALLGKAVTDAKKKAAVLTQAAGISLKDIQTIDYSWGEVNFEFRPMNRNLILEACAPKAENTGSYDMNIEPEDFSVSDTVTVVWEIE